MTTDCRAVNRVGRPGCHRKSSQALLGTGCSRGQQPTSGKGLPGVVDAQWGSLLRAGAVDSPSPHLDHPLSHSPTPDATCLASEMLTGQSISRDEAGLAMLRTRRMSQELRVIGRHNRSATECVLYEVRRIRNTSLQILLHVRAQTKAKSGRHRVL